MTDLLSFKCHLALAACVFLAACGGGGGSAGGGNGSGSSNSDVNTPGLTITPDKSQLSFVSLDPSWDATQSIRFSLSSVANVGTYYAKVETDQKAIFDTRITDSTLTSLTVTMSTKAPASDINGQTVFKLCNDSSCNSVVWSRTLPYQIHAYQIDKTPIQLTAFQGGTASTQRSLNHVDAASDLSVTARVSYNQTWLTAQIDGNGQLVVSAAGAGQPQGSYNGWVQVALKSDPNTAVQIPVAIQMGAGSSLPANSALDFDGNSPAVLNGAIALAYQGNQSPAWNAASDKPWLTLAAASGTGNSNVAYRIDGAKLASLPNFTADTANVTFKSAGMDDSVYSVTLTKKLPEVMSVAPGALRAGLASEVHLHGRGLLQLGTVSHIALNGQALTSGSILSDTDAVIDLPALNAGGYPLALSTASGLGVTQPSISVASTQALPAALLDSVGSKLSIAVSAQRNAFYVVNADRGQLQRFRVVNGAWTLDKSLAIGGGTRIGLSLDQRLLYTTNGNTLEARDPDTLAVTDSYTCDYSFYLYTGQGLPITNDGRIWFSTSSWSLLAYFDTRTKAWGTLPQQSQLLNYPTYAVSADGSRMIVNTQYLSGGDVDAFRYDPATGTLDAPANSPFFGNAGTALSGNGKYVLIGDSDYYDASNYTPLGKMPAGVGGAYIQAMVSGDGSLIYAVYVVAVDPNSTAAGNLSVTGVDVIRTSDMSKIGRIPLPAGVVVCAQNAFNCPAFGTFALSIFDDAIFWAGNMKIAVVPIPQALQPSATASRFRMIR